MMSTAVPMWLLARIVLVSLTPVEASASLTQEDVADVPSRDLLAKGEERMRYFLIGAEEESKAPDGGFKLLLVLPGGDGSADFNPFVRRIWKKALGPDYLVAQLVAPMWSADQAEKIVWPAEKNGWPSAEFTTEEFIEAVIDDVQSRHEIDPAHVFTLSWSSSGPAAYSYSLFDEGRATGSLIAMSVFKPDQLPNLKGAKGHAYYLLHSPEDFIPIQMAKNAEEQLEKKGAEVELEEYAGGHGWHGDMYGMIARGIEWLEKNHATPKKRKQE